MCVTLCRKNSPLYVPRCLSLVSYDPSGLAPSVIASTTKPLCGNLMAGTVFTSVPAAPRSKQHIFGVQWMLTRETYAEHARWEQLSLYTELGHKHR